MIKYRVAYFGITGSGPGHFDCLASSLAPTDLFQNQIIFSKDEVRDLYLDWYQQFVNGIELHLVTCTRTELTSQEIEKLIYRAIEFAEEQCS